MVTLQLHTPVWDPPASGIASLRGFVVRETIPPVPPKPRLLDRVRQALQARHGSRRTEKAYVAWIRRYILFHGKRHPVEMGAAEITQFLSSLATEGNVAASTQNQALSALLFLYRHVLEQELPWLDGVVRAKRAERLPVVLTREEVRAILRELHGPPRLMTILLYGAGLRLLECARLRVQDVDFAANQIVVRAGKRDRERRKFRFKNKLVSLDSTVIDLCATLFDWAQFRRTKGAVKLHCLLDHDGYLPSVVVVTEGKRHDVRVARTLRFDPGTIVVMDRGYVDYAWFSRLTIEGVFFVTRLKDNALYRVVERRRAPERSLVQRDEVIRLTGVAAETRCPHNLRRVEVYDPDKDETLVFLTNQLALGATTIAAIYKDRWQIELFFKALKQNLKIKTFVGTSANALKVQVWTALIAMLLLKYLQLRSRFAWSLSNLVALLRMNLFTHRDLWRWVDQPFEGPPTILVAAQGELPLR